MYRLTGKTRSELFDTNVVEPFPCQAIKLIVAPADRGRLHQDIEQRFGQMLAQGLVEETQALYNRKDLGLEKPAIRAVGYRQVWAYLDGDTDYDTMAERAVIATRQLARRQFTWLRKEQDARWFETGAAGLADRVTQHLREVAGTFL